MEDDLVLSPNRPESLSTNPPGHLWRDKWTALSGPPWGKLKGLEDLLMIAKARIWPLLSYMCHVHPIVVLIAVCDQKQSTELCKSWTTKMKNSAQPRHGPIVGSYGGAVVYARGTLPV